LAEVGLKEAHPWSLGNLSGSETRNLKSTRRIIWYFLTQKVCNQILSCLYYNLIKCYIFLRMHLYCPCICSEYAQINFLKKLSINHFSVCSFWVAQGSWTWPCALSFHLLLRAFQSGLFILCL
jgi:hypothetical protein